ncbi:Putative pentatricopeptide repeat-containing protein At1g31840 [Linum perenne]
MFFASSTTSKVYRNIRSPFLLLSFRKIYPCCSTFSSHSNSTKRTVIHEICNALHQQQNPKLLDRTLLSKLEPYDVQPILLSLHLKPNTAIQFFECAEKFLNSPHSPQSFCALLQILLNRNLYAPATKVFDKLIEQHGNNHETWCKFCEGFQDLGPEGSSVLYGFLIENCCRKAMVDTAVQVFLYICNERINVSPKVVWGLLDCLLELQLVDKIVDHYDAFCRLTNTDLSSFYRLVMEVIIRKGKTNMGLKLHKSILQRGVSVDIVTCNKILKGLCLQSKTGIADDYFNELITVGPVPNVVTFSTLINKFCKQGDLDKAFELYDTMTVRGLVADLIVYSILIDGLFKAGRLVEGNRLLSAALDCDIRFDVVVFSSVIDAYVRAGDLEKAVEVYRTMLKEEISPNLVSYSILIKGLCQSNRILEASGVFGKMAKHGFEPSVSSYCSLIDGLSKSGNLSESFRLYMDMKKHGHEPDDVICNGWMRKWCSESVQIARDPESETGCCHLYLACQGIC